MSVARILFEPWGLGDTLVAVATAREMTGPVRLACQEKWHALLRLLLPSTTDLLPVTLPYTLRDKPSRWRRGPVRAVETGPCEVLSIRGDPRDWLAARDLFPRGKIRMSGWCQFGPHYTRLLDWPFATGLVPVRNRYRAWAELAGVPFARLEESCRVKPATGPVVIHVGASRRSRQYPHVRALRDDLRSRGEPVQLLAAPGDLLPAGIEEADVSRVTDKALLDALTQAKLVITNDSASMHLAGLLGCRTVVVARVTNIAEWRPPGVQVVASPQMPRGYRKDSRSNTDLVLEGWPTPAEVLAAHFNS